ncbi:MAG: stage V sporulation protein T [Lachnospiraceae bacterium]|nr:stage V sporulation protein T [Lachnospiraceae bacterium]
MKATGIVRRIDELGRVVIPKEIRRTLRIREGDPLEIFTDRKGEVILKKYSPIGELSAFAKQYAEALAQTTGNGVCIVDKDQIIAVAGGIKKDYNGQPITPKLEESIEERKLVVLDKRSKDFFLVSHQMEGYEQEVIAPIICQGDAIGAVVILKLNLEQENTEVDEKLASAAANFLGKQMEQ